MMKNRNSWRGRTLNPLCPRAIKFRTTTKITIPKKTSRYITSHSSEQVKVHFNNLFPRPTSDALSHTRTQIEQNYDRPLTFEFQGRIAFCTP